LQDRRRSHLGALTERQAKALTLTRDTGLARPPCEYAGRQ